MSDEDRVIHGSGDVFADLGLANAEEHQTKARLVSQIADIIEERNLTQVQAGAIFGIDQPKVSALLYGRFRGFSVYRLMSFIAALGRDAEITARRPGRLSGAADTGHILVR